MRRNLISYISDEERTIIHVSGTVFDRKMQELVRGGQKTRAFTSPMTVLVLAEEAFEDVSSLRSVVVSEGVQEMQSGVFRDSGLEEIRLPSTM